MIQNIFGKYDIRGKATIIRKEAPIIGEAIVEYFKPRSIIIGKDTRKSSELIKKELISVFLKRPIKVYDVGVISTPGIYYLSRFSDMAINITASHLPLNMNGLKIIYKGNVIGYENGLKDIAELYSRKKKTLKKSRVAQKKEEIKGIKKSYKKGYLIKNRKYILKYYNFLKRFIINTRDINKTIFVDFGNGAGTIYSKLLKGRNIFVLNSSTKTITRDPNPLSKAALRSVKSKIERIKTKNKKNKKENRRDSIAFLFDLDADRVITLNENLQVVLPDFIGALIALSHRSWRGKNIVVDVRTSEGVISELRKAGYNIILSKVGHSYMKENMVKYKAIFGFETSGHYYFSYTKGFDNAFIAMMNVLYVLKKEKMLKTAVERFRYYECTKDIAIKTKNKELFVKKVKEIFQGAKKELFVDGISLYFSDFWFNVRPSNTENVVRIRIEGKTKEICERVINEIKKIKIK